MDIQTVIVIFVGLAATIYLARKYSRAARGRGGCGCGCEGGCPAEKRGHCGGGK